MERKEKKTGGWFYTPVDPLWEGSACSLPIEVNRKVLTHHCCNWLLKRNRFLAAAKRPRDVKWPLRKAQEIRSSDSRIHINDQLPFSLGNQGPEYPFSSSFLARDTSPSFAVASRIVDSHDGAAGMSCYKDGNAMGSTSSAIGQTEVHLFHRGTPIQSE